MRSSSHSLKIGCVLLLLSLSICAALAESLLQSPQGQQLLLDVKGATADNDMMNRSFADEILAAQIRIAIMGPQADEMLARMAVEEIGRWRSGTANNITDETQGLSLSSLIFLVSHDPHATKLMIDPLMDWLDAAATGKIREGADITQRAALYINQWGTPEQKARVKADTEIMLKSSDYQTHFGGEMIQHGLNGREIGRVPNTLNGPFSDYCSWAASYTQHIRSGEPLPSVEVRSHWRLDLPQQQVVKPGIANLPAPASPVQKHPNHRWLIGMLTVLVFACGGIGIAIRRKVYRG